MQHVERRFISVEGRRVHFRRTGKGPPVVMLHASPANSEMVLAEMAAAAPHFTCIAFDTPGFGDSEPLTGDPLTMADLADATAAAMGALDLPPCPVFGTHTGAAIALELGARRPERVSGLVLDAVPVFTDAEFSSLFRDFFLIFDADPLGAHLTRIWMRFRDQFTWFPWNARRVDHLNPCDRPSPQEIQHWVMMYNRARLSYLPAYRAACHYGQGALRAAQALATPAVYLATADDMLYPHLDRLPPLRDRQRIVRLPPGSAAKHAVIVDCLRALPPAPTLPLRRPTEPIGRGPALQFIDTDDGQSYVRCYGDPAHPAVLLLHDAPGTGLALDGLARRLAVNAYVVVPDLPGTGDSDAPADGATILAASARAIDSILRALGIERFVLAALGCGCAVAATYAAGNDPRLIALVLERVPVPNEATAQAIAPEIALSPEGAHWLQVWLMVRDAQIYDPWFDGRMTAQRPTQGNFDAEWLHDQTFALMKSRASYFLLPRAAHRFDTAQALRSSAVPPRIAEPGGLEALIAAAWPPDRR